MSDISEKLAPVLDGLLEDGESLRGMCVATQASLFKGRMVGIGTTDRRLLIQPLDRKFELSDSVISAPPERLADASAEGISGGWPNLAASVMDRAAVTLKLKLADGDNLKLMMMRGGEGMLGGLGGGETQRQGVEALADWFARVEARG